MTMTDVEKLLVLEDIRRLKAAYFRCMDTKDWDDFPGLFTQDATFDVRGALEMPKSEDAYADEPVITGRAAILDYVRNGLTPLTSAHHGHMPEIEIISPVAATGVWAMSDILVLPAGGPFRVFRGYGQYRETYVREGGEWRIATLKLRRFHVEMTH
jgi:hypothetical protein